MKINAGMLMETLLKNEMKSKFKSRGTAFSLIPGLSPSEDFASLSFVVYSMTIGKINRSNTISRLCDYSKK